MYKRANSIMAFNIMYSFPLFEAGKPKREWETILFCFYELQDMLYRFGSAGALCSKFYKCLLETNQDALYYFI